MKVICGTSSERLGTEICDRLECEKSKVEIVRFPDSECYVRIGENLDGEDVLLVCNSYPDRNIIELFLLQDAINTFKIKSLTTLIPYFGYGRQDKIFKPGESIVAHGMARRIGLCTDRVIVVDIHESAIVNWFGCECISVSAMRDIGIFFRVEKGVDLIIAPDEGALGLARTAADAACVEYDYIVKHRIYLQGARQVYVACTHGLFSEEVCSHLNPNIKLTSSSYSRKLISELQKILDNDHSRMKSPHDDVLFCTDTLDNPCSVISVAGAIIEEIR